MLDVFVGLGLLTLGLLIAYSVFFAIAWIIAVIRVATNKVMSGSAKTGWILATIFIPGASAFYFILHDRGRFLRFMGWLMILPMVAAMSYFLVMNMLYGPPVATPALSTPTLSAPAPSVPQQVAP